MGHGASYREAADLSENEGMQRIFYTLVLSTLAAVAHAQYEPNILGLPAIPQKPPAPPAPQASASAPKAPASATSAARGRSPASAASASKTAPPPPDDNTAKAVLSGGVTLASSYVGALSTVRVTTNSPYQGEALRAQAITAARLVQRDLRVSCGTQCKPAAMGAPQILKDGKLQFDMVVEGFTRTLTQEDMIAMVMGRPLAVVAAKPAAAPSVTSVTASSAAPSPATKPAPEAPAAEPAASAPTTPSSAIPAKTP
jgi:hypothetical protein